MKQIFSTKWDVALCTGLYLGLCPFAPGTMGAIGGTVLWLILDNFLSYWWLQLILVLLIICVTLLSIPSIQRIEKDWGEDPSKVVIDEIVGVWIALLAVPATDNYLLKIGAALCAFILFRIFDIFKPLGIRSLEKVPKGWGVMLDDILAGFYSYIVLLGISFMFF